MGEAAILECAAGKFTRREVTRKGYSVEPTTYWDLRFNEAK